jgi:hypothetical protein
VNSIKWYRVARLCTLHVFDFWGTFIGAGIGVFLGEKEREGLGTLTDLLCLFPATSLQNRATTWNAGDAIEPAIKSTRRLVRGTKERGDGSRPRPGGSVVWC